MPDKPTNVTVLFFRVSGRLDPVAFSGVFEVGSFVFNVILQYNHHPVHYRI